MNSRLSALVHVTYIRDLNRIEAVSGAIGEWGLGSYFLAIAENKV